MRWLWILGIIAAVCLLLGQIRLGLLVTLDGQTAADLRVGPFRIRLSPAKSGKKKPPKKAKPKKTPADLSRKWKKFPRPDREDIRSAIRLLGPPFRRVLHRLRRGIRIDPLELSVTLGGRDDPAAAAEQYGLAQAGVWSILPAVQQQFRVPHPSVHIGLDFDREGLLVRGRIGVSLRLGTLLHLGTALLVPGIRWLLAFRKRHPSKTKKTENPTAGNPAAAA